VASISLNCRAKTLHSWAGIGLGKKTVEEIVNKIRYKPGSLKNWRNTDLLIIDEISMMTGDLFDKLNKIAKIIRKNKKPFGGIQIVLCGDFCQLPPVITNNKEIKNKFAFECESWFECMNGKLKIIKKDEKSTQVSVLNYGNIIMLTDNHRQAKDPEYAEALKEIRFGRVSKATRKMLKERLTTMIPEDIKTTKIYTRNIDVNAMNQMELEALERKIFEFPVAFEVKRNYTLNDKQLENIKGNMIKGYCGGDSKLRLAQGAQVMLTYNLIPEIGLVNGSKGIINEISSEGITIDFENSIRQLIEPKEYEYEDDDENRIIMKQFPLRLAYAITIHKSQGATLQDAVIDCGSGIFEYGQSYVALSRVRTIKGLYLIDFDYKKIKIHPKVRDFYNKIIKI
jgi:ATP-dependent DNA helicase PIF1